MLPSQNALGRVCYTSDLWSDLKLISFMAITAHYLAKGAEGRWELRSCLLAFRYIQGDHSGAALSREFYNVLKEADVLNRVSAPSRTIFRVSSPS